MSGQPKRVSKISAAFVLGSVLVSAAPAFAAIDEIIVTATKRESLAQNTSIALSVFDQELLDNLGIQDVIGLGNFVPGMLLGQDNNDWKVTIRGVGSDNLDINAEPGVALHVDGVYLARPSGFNALTYDIERVEVLRGPQGTLYGRNATGGAINVIAQRPSYDYEAKGDVLYGDFDRIRGRAAVNIPISKDKVAFRGSVVYENTEGYQENVNPDGEDGNDTDDVFVRGQVLWDVNEDLSIIGRISHLRQRGTTSRIRLASPPTSTAIDGAFLPDFPDDLQKVFKDHPESNELDQTLYNAELNYQLNFAEAKAILGYSEVEYTLSQDSDITMLAFGEPGGESSNANRTQAADQFTTEVQLNSLPESKLGWLIGAFYLKEEAEGSLDVRRMITGPPFPPFSGLISTTVDNDNMVETTSYAFFGEANYEIVDNVTVKAGVRYTKDEREGFGDFATVLFNPGIFFGGEPSGIRVDALEFGVENSWSKTTWKAGVDWQATDDNLLYFTASTGFRSGGFNFGTSVADELFYDPESLLAYEIGSKNQFLDNSLQLNLTGFYYDYDDLQVFQIIDSAAFVQNAAKAEIWGLEAEFIAEIAEGLRIDGHVSYQNAEYVDFLSRDQVFPDGLDGIPDNGDELFDVSGNTLINAPELSGRIGMQYTHPIANFGDLTWRIQTYLQSDIYLRQFNLDPFDTQEGFSKTDFTLRLNDQDNRWHLFAGVENIEDQDIVSNIDVNPTGLFFANVRPPRSWHVGLGVSF